VRMGESLGTRLDVDNLPITLTAVGGQSRSKFAVTQGE